MTNQQHLITPPPELVQQWVDLLTQGSKKAFAAAAQWGADQELDACCEWLMYENDRQGLRAARRPKPPSLKQQALKRLTETERTLIVDPDGIIRRALEQLDD